MLQVQGMSDMLYCCSNKAPCTAKQREILVLRMQLLQVGHIYCRIKVKIYEWLASEVDTVQMQILKVSVARALSKTIGTVQMANRRNAKP
jgi:hypothetical protein